jgi:hypothetical protein
MGVYAISVYGQYISVCMLSVIAKDDGGNNHYCILFCCRR